MTKFIKSRRLSVKERHKKLTRFRDRRKSLQAKKEKFIKSKKKSKCCKCHYVKTNDKRGKLRKVRGSWGHCSYDMENCCKDKKTIVKLKKQKGGKLKSLKKARILSKTKYEDYLKKRKTKKKLNKKQNKDLDHTLFIKYCKCIKYLKYNKKVESGSEYPICTSSIYNKRGFTPPKNIKMKCKQYR